VLKLTEATDKTAGPYVQYRSMYAQSRRAVIEGKVDQESPTPITEQDD
jgi:ABC-type transporter lipoprotein component MlaA